MPLRDHFHPPISEEFSWEGFHSLWPATIVQHLAKIMPPGYRVEPRVRLGGMCEIDVAAIERLAPAPSRQGGTVLWTAPKHDLEIDVLDPPEYEALVFESGPAKRLVAAIEIVSPANKDRPLSRREFVAKCAALFQRNICVGIIDLVTSRRGNLYGDLLDLLGQDDARAAVPAPAYAATCRRHLVDGQSKLRGWYRPLEIGQPLPTLPLWLSEELSVPLDLETPYEEACRTLGID